MVSILWGCGGVASSAQLLDAALELPPDISPGLVGITAKNEIFLLPFYGEPNVPGSSSGVGEL